MVIPIIPVIRFLIQFAIVFIIRGFVGGGILFGMTKLLKTGKSDLASCFSVSAFSHGIVILLIVTFSGLINILQLLNVIAENSWGIRGSIYSGHPFGLLSLIRVLILVFLHAWFIAKYLDYSQIKSAILAVITMLVYYGIVVLILEIYYKSYWPLQSILQPQGLW